MWSDVVDYKPAGGCNLMKKMKERKKKCLIFSLSPFSMFSELREYIKRPSVKLKCNIDSCLQFVKSVKYVAE